MEVGLAYAAALQPKPCHVRRRSLFPQHGKAVRRRVSTLIKAVKSSNPTRHTLSSNWDVSNFAITPSAPSRPSLEDLDTTNMLLRQRIVFLGSMLDDMTADFIISQLLFLDAEDPEKDIKLFINSPGGSVTAGMGIYDAMKLCTADISTVCLGLAASTAAFLLACGTKGKRFCMPNSKVMFQQPLGTAGGTVTEFAIRVREMNYQRIKLEKILSRITGKPREQIEKESKYENFMNPWEAKEYGLVDAVIDDGKPGLVAPITDATPPPKTPILGLWRYDQLAGPTKDFPLLKDIPSERKLLQNGSAGNQANDGGKESVEPEKTEAPS